MDCNLSFSFCSRGSFVKSTEDAVRWFERSAWTNQYGAGKIYELNLVWFRVVFESYRSNPKEVTDGEVL